MEGKPRTEQRFSRYIRTVSVVGKHQNPPHINNNSMANGASGDGTVTIEYMRNAANQKEMAIAGGKLAGGTAEIDELFCFSFVMKDCNIHLASRHERDWSPSQYRKKHPDAEKNP